MEPSLKQNLQEWLHLPQFEILTDVLRSLVFAKEAEAANALKQWQGGVFPQYQDAAIKAAIEAEQFARTMTILKDLRDQKEYFRFTATPT